MEIEFLNGGWRAFLSKYRHLANDVRSSRPSDEKAGLEKIRHIAAAFFRSIAGEKSPSHQ
jgi:hypothetical protein